jgi:hypothetical protein
MTSDLDSRVPARGDRARSRVYLREFGIAMGAYVVVLVAVLLWGDVDGHSPWRYALVALPAVPAIGIAWAVLRHIRRVDEYQRRILLEGLAAGFALAMVAAVTLGLLAAAGLVLAASPWIVYAVGMLGWVVAGAVASRR